MTPADRLRAEAAEILAEAQARAARLSALADSIDADQLDEAASNDDFVFGLKSAAAFAGISLDALRGIQRRGEIYSEWRGGRRAFRKVDLLDERSVREAIERGARLADCGRPIATNPAAAENRSPSST